MSIAQKVAVVVTIMLAVAFVAYICTDLQRNISGEYPLPQNLDIAYKEIQIRGILGTERYVIVDVAGYNYFVTETVFNAILVTQKIGDGLYRMPDGVLLTMAPEK